MEYHNISSVWWRSAVDANETVYRCCQDTNDVLYSPILLFGTVGSRLVCFCGTWKISRNKLRYICPVFDVLILCLSDRMWTKVPHEPITFRQDSIHPGTFLFNMARRVTWNIKCLLFHITVSFNVTDRSVYLYNVILNYCRGFPCPIFFHPETIK
jgi:hypothetical protein